MRVRQNNYTFDLEDVIKSNDFDFLMDRDRSIYRKEFFSESSASFYRAVSHLSNKTISNNFQRIDEATRKEILSEIDSKRRARAKNKVNRITVRYEGVTHSRGWIKFSTNSQTIKGKRYTQYIKLKEAKDMRKFHEFNKREIIRLFMSGDIQVWCSCKDFQYRFKHMAYGLGYGIFKENRFPAITNPKLEGSVCKHLICVLQTFPMNHFSIERDMLKTKYFKDKYSGSSSLSSKKKSKSSGNI